jgi:hypothetical protein
VKGLRWRVLWNGVCWGLASQRAGRPGGRKLGLGATFVFRFRHRYEKPMVLKHGSCFFLITKRDAANQRRQNLLKFDFSIGLLYIKTHASVASSTPLCDAIRGSAYSYAAYLSSDFLWAA